MRTDLLGLVRGLLSLVVLPLLVACGGGGDGGGGGGGSSGSVVYAGNTNPAVVTDANASQLTANVVGSDDTASTILGVSIESGDATTIRRSGVMDLALSLNRSFRDTVLRVSDAQRVVRAVQIDETEPCDNGVGSIRTSGTLSDVNFTGTLAVSFNSCLVDGDTFDGPATLRVDEFSFAFPQGIPSDSTLSFARLTIRGPGVSVDTGGSLRLQLNFGTNTETVTANLVAQNNNTGQTSKTENLVFVNVYNNIFSPTSFTTNVSGRIFDRVHGYVDIATVSPLVFGNISQLFPDSGQIVLTGAANRRIRATALSATLARLELDLNGDGGFEIVATLKWTDLSGPVGSDLADTDVDGMHNSWETANPPMNPNLDDATLDNDSDGTSNLIEYQFGTDPNNANSTPPIADLSITVTDSPDPVVTGGSLTYTITVFNSSATSVVSNIVVVDTLPAGVTLTSVTASQGSCSGTSLLSCNLGTLLIFGNATVTAFVTPTLAGIVHNTATVTSGSFDPNTTNNSATSITAVGQLVAGLQVQIDNAAPGDTILVGPGVYLGGLNFNGNNITLQSSAGPASTVIHGNNGTAVQMGPGGAIKGFTITGSSESSIEASGQGSLISGNIFDGNVLNIGAMGAGVRGNNASPTIERNIFRNNSCDNQLHAGVVSFVNNSSPLIANNVFENNQCLAISLTLPEGNAPQVINNTLVGNRTGIRIAGNLRQVTQIYRNNIIVQNAIGFDIELVTLADSPVWGNNLVFDNTTNYQGIANQTGISGNISANPMFINAAVGNYHLQPGSPAIDAGSAIGAPGVDFDESLRPRDGNGDGSVVVDIGAFEAPSLP